jgi:hypothetical protein
LNAVLGALFAVSFVLNFILIAFFLWLRRKGILIFFPNFFFYIYILNKNIKTEMSMASRL